MFIPYEGKVKVSQTYKGSKHKGFDFVGLDSKNIIVPQDSSLVIEFVGWDSHPTGGMGLYIRGRRIKDGMFAYFAHLSKIYVKVGDYARPGNLLGIEGSTGHSTGSHLHYEIRDRAGDNMSFVDIVQICEIPNKTGIYEATEIEAPNKKEEGNMDGKDVIINIGDKEVWGKLLPNGEVWGPVRKIVDAITDIEISWDGKEQEVDVKL